MKKLLKSICLLLSVICVFTITVSCNKSDYTYWQTNAQESGNARLTYVSELSFGGSRVNVSEVWVNISKPGTSKVNVTVELYKYDDRPTKTIPGAITKADIKESKDGWIKIYDGANVECTKAVVKVMDKMRFNEIYFVNGDKKPISVSFSVGGVQSGNSEIILSKDELDKLKESDVGYNKYPAYNIVDEQEKFPKEKLN